MKILRVIATVDLRHGGPAAGLEAVTPVLAALGHESAFVTLDDPRISESRFANSPVFALGSGACGYAYSPRFLPWLRAHAASYDVVIVHGLWQYHGRAVRAALHGTTTPYFVFPHGMLDENIRRTSPLKHTKKWLYWHAFERRVLRDAAAVLYTSEEECRLARGTFGGYRCRERVVTYGTAGPTSLAEPSRAAFRRQFSSIGEQPYWLFLGRLHPKKGLDLLIKAYAAICARHSGKVPALVLAGPCDDEAYLRDLRTLVEMLCPAGTVHWTGMITDALKWGALHGAEALVLPSHQENFGLVVAEALACGTPVLISNQVNIWREIEADRAGLIADDSLEGTTTLLARWRDLPSVERAAMRAAARACFLKRYEIEAVARSLMNALTSP